MRPTPRATALLLSLLLCAPGVHAADDTGDPVVEAAPQTGPGPEATVEPADAEAAAAVSPTRAIAELRSLDLGPITKSKPRKSS